MPSQIVRRIVLCVSAVSVVNVAAAAPADAPLAAPYLQRLDAHQSAELERQVQALYARLSPSVVRLIPDPNSEGGFSGVIVGPEGHVFTCAHYDLPPGTKVGAQLSDGRRVAATTLGYFRKPDNDRRQRLYDVGAVKLEGTGPWPAADLGKSREAKFGDLCVGIGYPYGHAPGQPPLLRLGRILPPARDGAIRTSLRGESGDSGGPVFDLRGAVLGAFSGGGSVRFADAQYARAEAFVEHRQRLLAGETLTADKEIPGAPYDAGGNPWGAFEPAADLAAKLAAPRLSVVEVLGDGDDGKVLALGLVVAPDGWVVTKRSEVVAQAKPACRLAGGRVVTARLAAGSVERDLALLKLDVDRLPVPKWAETGAPRIGQLVATVMPASLHVAIVGAVKSKNTPITGILSIQRFETAAPNEPRGARVAGLPRVWTEEGTAELLRVGDVITHFNGTPTPTAEALAAARDANEAGPNGVAGERVKLTVVREGKTGDVFVPLGPSRSNLNARLVPLSLRRTGFPNVFSHDGGAANRECGGPVVDLAGNVIGLNIARADEVQTFAIPADDVRKVAAELMAQAPRE